MIRYRTGIDASTGRLLMGRAHLWQSIGKVLTTQLGEVVMLLDYGAELIRHIGQNMGAGTVLAIYQDAVRAIHTWEPEYRVNQVQLLQLERTGGVGLGLFGLYFPEGRFGNFDISEEANATLPILSETRGAAR